MGILHERLMEWKEHGHYPLHMPGHKRQLAGVNPYAYDITEIGGFDNLHHLEGILKEEMERAASFYRTKHTWYLVGGSTCGLLAAIFAQTADGDEILIARNCHKAVYHGCALRNLRITYLCPKRIDAFGINGAVEACQVERALAEHPKAKAVVITSPTYEGIVSDIRAIRSVCHRYGAVLIVDEAHGAHFGMEQKQGEAPYFPESAVSAGADYVVQSLHKTMPGLTMTALLHENEGEGHSGKAAFYLSVFESSSPSYVLLDSISQCIDFVEKQESAFARYIERLERLRNVCGACRRIRLLQPKDVAESEGEDDGEIRLDRGKIALSVRGCVYEGHRFRGIELQKLLREKYQLELEMASDEYVIAMTSVCDSEEGLLRFAGAIQEIDGQLQKNEQFSLALPDRPDTTGKNLQSDEWALPECVMTIGQALTLPSRYVELRESIGAVCADFLTVYPPGIPFCVPGERITEEIAEKILRAAKAGLEVIGAEPDAWNRDKMYLNILA